MKSGMAWCDRCRPIAPTVVTGNLLAAARLRATTGPGNRLQLADGSSCCVSRVPFVGPALSQVGRGVLTSYSALCSAPK